MKLVSFRYRRGGHQVVVDVFNADSRIRFSRSRGAREPVLDSPFPLFKGCVPHSYPYGADIRISARYPVQTFDDGLEHHCTRPLGCPQGRMPLCPVRDARQWNRYFRHVVESEGISRDKGADIAFEFNLLHFLIIGVLAVVCAGFNIIIAADQGAVFINAALFIFKKGARHPQRKVDLVDVFCFECMRRSAGQAGVIHGLADCIEFSPDFCLLVPGKRRDHIPQKESLRNR